jgi:hypothetical protein
LTSCRTLQATAGHPFLVQGSGWVVAESSEVGDRLVTPGHATDLVTRVVDRGWLRDQFVVNLGVASLHTYTVWAGDAAVVVHNSYCGSFTKKTWRAARGAKQMARRLRGKGIDARYRGPCGSGNHYHCDIYDRRGSLQATYHFRWRN